MKIKFVLGSVLAAIGLLTTQNAVAQTGESNVRWKGTNVDNLTNGTKIYLYNVGTGRFVVHGGDWGTQARLFDETYGKLLTYYKSGNTVQIRTGVETTQNAVLGCNVPRITAQQGWNDTSDGGVTQTLTVIMDAHGDYSGSNNNRGTRSLTFVPVTETGSDIFTYYIYETLGSNSVTNYYNRNTNFYIGAAYGENGSDVAYATENNPTGAHDLDPVGKICLLSSSFDKVVWSTAVPGTSTEYSCGVKNAELEGLAAGTTSTTRSMQSEVPIFNEDTKIPVSDLYKWRIVTEEQFLAAIDGTADITDGLSANLTSEIADRGFERSDNSFFADNGWKVGRVSGVTYTNSGTQANGYRYGYTWGCTAAGGTTQEAENQEPWNAPVRLKAEFTGDYQAKNDAKYGFLEFEGAGTVSTSFVAPVAGVYKISAWGFYSGSHEAYLFATTENPQVTSGTSYPSSSSFTKVALQQVTTNPWLNADKKLKGSVSENNFSGVMAAGVIFLNNYNDKARYLREIEITLNEGQTVYFGVGKDGATKCDANSSLNGNAYDYRSYSYWDGYSYYYHDTDWVGVDQFQIFYLGTEPAKLLDEDKSVPFNDATYLGTTEYQNRTVRLHRNFQRDMWNSFVFPMDLTAVQVRSAFGDATRVAKLDGLGTQSKNANIIDFVTISLPAEGPAIEAGKYYLIRPTKVPTAGTQATENKDYYTMGSFTFSGNSMEPVDQTTRYNPAAGSANSENHNSIEVRGTYYSSLDYDGADNKNPITSGAYVPKGSYVISNNRVYHTQNDLKTKGFRAWIVDVESQQAKAFKMAINGVSDETTAIEDVFVNTGVVINSPVVYDMSGRRVAESVNQLNTLPKGIYIVNGKKYVVK